MFIIATSYQWHDILSEMLSVGFVDASGGLAGMVVASIRKFSGRMFHIKT